MAVVTPLFKGHENLSDLASRFVEVDGKPHREQIRTINLGIAVDMSKPNGPRSLVVPNVKDCGRMNFATFMAAYDAQVQKARKGRLSAWPCPASLMVSQPCCTGGGGIAPSSRRRRASSG